MSLLIMLSSYYSAVNSSFIKQRPLASWGRKIAMRLVVLLVAIASPTSLTADNSGFEAGYEPSTRANDLLYGEALYEYHQGRFFESLTVLNVAKEKGGIKRHGDHPLLVEGGLMLAYGMTREAQSHFEKVLSPDMAPLVSDDARNQAWFYLGKVFYLEQDFVASQGALAKVDSEKLLEADETLYLEWRYLNAQMSLNNNDDEAAPQDPDDQVTQKLATNKDSLKASAEQNDLWSVYILYNQALLGLTKEDDIQNVINGLLAALEQVNRISSYYPANEDSEEQTEREALKDKIHLSLGQIFLQQEAFAEAVNYLQKIPYESLVSDEALFQYAVAQSNLEQHELALAALNRLNERTLFTPWLQQVPYALAFLYEKLKEPMLAAQAYKTAGDHYDELLETIRVQKESLNEASIITALEVSFSSNENESSDDYFNTERPGLQAAQYNRREKKKLADALGEQDTELDAYGRLRVRPSNFYLANLLSTEAFQITLRDLHELYKLQSSLQVWRSRLDSFDLMLDTRASQREQKLATVKSNLDEQNAALWTNRFSQYKQAIDKALSEEDLRFFMDESQIEFYEQIMDAKGTLAALPEGEQKQEFAAKLDRVERYFEWWIADRYGVNRWAAQREILKLGEAVDEFEQRRNYLQTQLENSAFQVVLASRVNKSGERLNELSAQIELVLSQTRESLIEKVSKELERQSVEIAQYRLASRHAQARLSDQLYRELSNEKSEEPSNINKDEVGQGDSAPINKPLKARDAREDVREEQGAKQANRSSSTLGYVSKEAFA